MVDPNIARWQDEDFSMERMIELSQGGSMPAGWMDAYGLYLRRVSADLMGLRHEHDQAERTAPWPETVARTARVLKD